MEHQPLFLDSITDAAAASRGKIAVSGSHGGMYPAAIASQAQLLAVLFNDAGVGMDQAGVAGVLALANTGMAAAAIDCQSCHIGSAADMWERGRISVTNRIAQTLGLHPGMTVTDAFALLTNAPTPTGQLPPTSEARTNISLPGTKTTVELLDSASLVTGDDAGKILITGSHGALIGGNPDRALKAAARIAVFNDAGFGADNIGTTRLPALDAKAVAAVTVSCNSARIGDAASALETGVITACNTTAQNLNAKKGQPVSEWLRNLPAPTT